MKNKNITFFIENDSHYRFVSNLIKELYKHNNLRIFSLKELTKEPEFERIELIVVNTSKDLMKKMLNLKCDYFFTTTPGLNSPLLPKSKITPKKERPIYIYIFHSLVSPNEIYANNSFKYFDYIISPSKIVSKQLKFLISRNTKVLDFGYLLFDNLKRFQYSEFDDSILIAPSWGDEGISQNDGLIKNIVNLIEKTTSEAVFRPHPMDVEKFKTFQYKNLILDLDLNLKNLNRYKYLITDCSGIALEFFFLTGRPVLFINVPKKIKRKISSKEKKLTFIEDEMKFIIGNTVEPTDLNSKNIYPHIEEYERANGFIKNICLNENVVTQIINFEFSK